MKKSGIIFCREGGEQLSKLSAVIKTPETIEFQEFGGFETSDSQLSHGTLKKFADVRTHLRKVSKTTLSISKKPEPTLRLFYVNQFQDHQYRVGSRYHLVP